MSHLNLPKRIHGCDFDIIANAIKISNADLTAPNQVVVYEHDNGIEEVIYPYNRQKRMLQYSLEKSFYEIISEINEQ